MKGLTHFISGVALSSFLVPAVKMASRADMDIANASFILVLGGLYGIMPDTMDFKLGQFFSVPDINVDCDPNHPDPQKMAEQIGKGMEKAFKENRYIKVQLYPMQLGANLWRQYVIKFDNEKNEVQVIINEVVSTSQIPFMGTEPKDTKDRIGIYKLQNCHLIETHGRPSVVDIMSGPQYGFYKSEGGVKIDFLPWHRTWSHSYVLGFFLSIPVWIIAFILKLPLWWLYGIVAFLGFAVHLTEDLTGHMGGALIWPFMKRRTGGLCLFKASNPHANFTVDYSAVVIIIFNLFRITKESYLASVNETIRAFLSSPALNNPFLYFLYFLIIPLGIYHLIVKLTEKKEDKKRGESVAEAALAEMAYEEEDFIE